MVDKRLYQNKGHQVLRFRMLMILISLWMFLGQTERMQAMDFNDFMDIGAAFMTNLTIHELGHQIIADEVGAENHHVRFFAKDNGQFYFGLSSYTNIPSQSRLPYAAGGERMAGYTFEYGLQSYRDEPTTFNKALLFFSTVDFLGYTLLSNYVYPDNEKFDPNVIRKETGCSKEMLLGFALTKSLINVYRIYNKDANIIPVIETTKDSALFMIGFHF